MTIRIPTLKEAKDALTHLEGAAQTDEGVKINVTSDIAMKLVDVFRLPERLKGGGLPQILGFINVATDIQSVGMGNTFIFTDTNIKQVLQTAKHA